MIIKVKAGDGGDGCVAFRREKYKPRCGPDGGDGGRGGSVIVEADKKLSSLDHLSSTPHYFAQSGENGKPGGCRGRDGDDLIIKVPTGTVIYDVEKNVIIKDLIHHKQRVVVVRGGRGGRGNKAFATATNQTPDYAQPGEKGEERVLRLELKCLADIGIIGLPNSGKSTLLSKLSNARPKIGDYLFTTLAPNLGRMEDEKCRLLTIADLPGIIEGASRGKGLGLKFLKDIERTKIIIHLVDVSENALQPPDVAYKVVRKELKNYSPLLCQKKEIVLANKTDLPLYKGGIRLLEKVCRKKVHKISALTGKGIKKLKSLLFKKFDNNYQKI